MVRNGWIASLSLALLLAASHGCFDGAVVEPADGGEAPGGGPTGGTGGQGASGAGGSANGAGGSGGAGPCEVDADCPSLNQCALGTCEQGSCGITNLSAKLLPANQIFGDCIYRECDGMGGVIDVPDPTDTPAADACASYACTPEGGSTTTYASIGTQCGLGLECDGMGVCVGCTSASQCPQSTCTTPVCEDEACVPVPVIEGEPVSGSPPNDCKRTVCSGAGQVMTVADDADPPASDLNPCTIEGCFVGNVLSTPVDVGETVEPENEKGCDGVCQGGNYAGRCGLRLYSRPFPMAGAWSFTTLSEAWQGQNAPPPDSVVAAEETPDGSRLFVIRQNTEIDLLYEFSGGAWKPSRTLSSVAGLESQPSISAIAIGDFGSQGIRGALTTATSPYFAYPFEVSGAGDWALDPAVELLAPGTPDRCPQHQHPVRWAFNEQRSPPHLEPIARTWKYCDGKVYQERNDTFVAIGSGVDEDESDLEITGLNDSPMPGTIVAAYYRKSIDTVFMIAP